MYKRLARKSNSTNTPPPTAKENKSIHHPAASLDFLKTGNLILEPISMSKKVPYTNYGQTVLLINDKFHVRSPESINLLPNIPSYSNTLRTHLRWYMKPIKSSHPAGDIPVRTMRESFDSPNIRVIVNIESTTRAIFIPWHLADGELAGRECDTSTVDFYAFAW